MEWVHRNATACYWLGMLVTLLAYIYIMSRRDARKGMAVGESVAGIVFGAFLVLPCWPLLPLVGFIVLTFRLGKHRGDSLRVKAEKLQARIDELQPIVDELEERYRITQTP
jgi:hypothetical protein